MEQSLSVFCDIFLKLHRDQIPFVVVTMVGSKGSAPQDIGSRMIVSESEIIFGTVGGGKVENHCFDLARELLASKTTIPSSYSWNLQRDIGMTCGGEVSFLFEPSRPEGRWNVSIFGAGHVSQELTRTLLRLDCQLTVIDNRKEWLEKLPEHPRLKIIHSLDMKKELDRIPESSFVLCMTMGHSTDTPILHRALTERKFPYLGVIGSIGKRNRIEKELRELGLSESRAKDFICPLGEKIGSNAPCEISISITAELMRMRDEKARPSPGL